MINSTVTLDPVNTDKVPNATAKTFNQELDAFEYQYFITEVKQQSAQVIDLE